MTDLYVGYYVSLGISASSKGPRNDPKGHCPQLHGTRLEILAILSDELLPTGKMLSQFVEVFASWIFLYASESSYMGYPWTSGKFHEDLPPGFNAISGLIISELPAPLIQVGVHIIKNEAVEFLSNLPAVDAVECGLEEVALENLVLTFQNILQQLQQALVSSS